MQGGQGLPRRTGQRHTEVGEFELTENGQLWTSHAYKYLDYVDGSTIDWLHEDASERERNQRLRSQEGVRGLVMPLVEATSMWLVVVLTGIGVGLTGACLDILVKW
jgi:chloride channel 3/4/5